MKKTCVPGWSQTSLVHSTSSSILVVTEAKVPYAVLWVDKASGMYMGAQGADEDSSGSFWLPCGCST